MNLNWAVVRTVISMKTPFLYDVFLIVRFSISFLVVHVYLGMSLSCFTNSRLVTFTSRDITVGAEYNNDDL